MHMHTANNDGIKILRVILLHISSMHSTGHTIETRQMTYVTDLSDKLFLSREACVALGIISDSFPQVHAIDSQLISAHVHDHTVASCSCHTRQVPPPVLSNLPFPASVTGIYRNRITTLNK